MPWGIALVALCAFVSSQAMAGDFGELDQKARTALASLYANTPAAKALADASRGVLVFPAIQKAALIVGGQGGDGVLLIRDRVSAHYSSGGVSVGLEVGAQTFGYAIFFMSNDALRGLETSSGWSLGGGPSFVMVDSGVAKEISTRTANAEIYVFVFNQKGVMGGVSVSGQKITKIKQ